MMNRTKKDGPVQVQGQEYDPLKKLMEGRYLRSAYFIRNRLQKKEGCDGKKWEERRSLFYSPTQNE